MPHTKKSGPIIIYNTLYDQYVAQGLPLDNLNEHTQFTIHSLRNILGQRLPFRSEVYKPNFFSFVFVKDAQGRYTTDELEFNTVPNMIYFTNPGHYKSHYWERLEEVYLVTLSESFLKENVHPRIFEEFPFLLSETVQPRVLRPEVYAEFEQLYLQIEQAFLSGSPYKNRIIGSLFVVILLKVKEYFWEDYNPIYEGNRSSQIVKTFKRMLEQHYRDLRSGRAENVFRVQDYAAAQHLHPNYLGNVIKTKTGKSISTWITEKTIAEAKSLLQHSDTPIKEIAYQLGFAESTHFSNYFKKYTALSPVLYRKNVKAAP
ncbi:MAG TPA: AraC family transcriptional regulator [Chitinophaga sp.]|uniref:helix-turn-helix domain-containing protein n=1 Tax=Chitinophaga sp. TaxID=1869181 RepID=UPI002DBA1CE6|nr:AraC family transcriptional regulator [Chitinophaga sp.]HEU4554060.1 AraC family transcriptional regulator [Chitinophaga sp.]